MMQNPKTLIICAVALLVVMGAGVAFYTARHYVPAPRIEGLLWPNPKVLRDFTTVDQDGKPFGVEQLRGTWSFLFFGYTHCPDVCPITMAMLNQVQDELRKDASGAVTRAVLVSVDPERDTPERLAEYVRHFDPEFVGLGGSLADVQSLAGQIGVAYYKAEPAADGSYLMDHSAGVFLIDPAGRLLAVFSAPQRADQITARFREIRDFVERSEGEG